MLADFELQNDLDIQLAVVDHAIPCAWLDGFRAPGGHRCARSRSQSSSPPL
jgi:hypothetical protein